MADQHVTLDLAGNDVTGCRWCEALQARDWETVERMSDEGAGCTCEKLKIELSSKTVDTLIRTRHGVFGFVAAGDRQLAQTELFDALQAAQSTQPQPPTGAHEGSTGGGG